MQSKTDQQQIQTAANLAQKLSADVPAAAQIAAAVENYQTTHLGQSRG